MKGHPRITFGMIVLNGEPFLRYNLRALYPFAHQIVVVEGAAHAAAGIATPDGHSRDETLQTLRSFKDREDPENKLTIVTAEDEGHRDGFWPGEKHAQSQAYARRATGDYIWQVDVDEFYKEADMTSVLELLRSEPATSGASFHQIAFWGSLQSVVDGWFLRRGHAIFHRLFRWGSGYRYVTHRPPTVLDDRGRDLRTLSWLDGRVLAKRGIHLYHYSLLFPKQVMEKCDYYSRVDWEQRTGATHWAEETYGHLRRPFRAHNVYKFPGWLDRYDGTHPHQVTAMWTDIEKGRIAVAVRRTDDIERLLSSRRYRVGREMLKGLDHVARCWVYPRSALGRLVRRWRAPASSL